MDLTPRQKEIIKIVKEEEPVTSQEIARQLNLTRAALRTDLALLTMARVLDAKPRVGYFYRPDSSTVWLNNILWGTKVSSVQSIPVVINQEATVHNAVVQLFLEDTDFLFVTEEEKKVVGIVSSKDLLKVLIGGGENRDLPVKVAMSGEMPQEKLKTEDYLYRALLIFQKNSIGAIPVFDSREDLVGRVTRQGILRFIWSQVDSEGEGVE